MRDMGGPAVSGGRLRPGVLFRSATLCGATPTDAALLRRRLGLRSVVDLRTEREVTRDGRPERLIDAGIRWQHSPLAVPGRFLAGTREAPAAEDYAREYRRLADLAGPVVRGLLECAARAEPVVFCCTTGKDRTGVVAALVAALLGVGRADLIADFTATGAALTGREPAFAALVLGKGITVDAFAARLRPDPDAMVRLLDGIEARFGSVPGWAAAHGVEADLVDRARIAMTVPVPPTGNRGGHAH